MENNAKNRERKTSFLFRLIVCPRYFIRFLLRKAPTFHDSENNWNKYTNIELVAAHTNVCFVYIEQWKMVFAVHFYFRTMSTSTFVHWSTWVRSLCYSCADIFSVSLLSLHQNVSICKHRTVFFLELQNEHWKIILNNVSISKIWLATYQFRCKLFDNSSTRKTSLNSTFSKGYFITLAENEHISDVWHHLQFYISSRRM